MIILISWTVRYDVDGNGTIERTEMKRVLLSSQPSFKIQCTHHHVCHDVHFINETNQNHNRPHPQNHPYPQNHSHPQNHRYPQNHPPIIIQGGRGSVWHARHPRGQEGQSRGGARIYVFWHYLVFLFSKFVFSYFCIFTLSIFVIFVFHIFVYFFIFVS